MAKSWSGFLPQNELIKLYWEALEISKSELSAALKSFSPGERSEETEDSDEESEMLPRLGFPPLA